MLSFFPRGVLDEILNLIESVSEGFPSYSFLFLNDETVLMMGHKICFCVEIWLIIPKLYLLPLLIWSTEMYLLVFQIIIKSRLEITAFFLLF